MRTIRLRNIPISFAEIKAKYRQLAKKLHPDSDSGSDSEFISLQTAYEKWQEFFGV